MRSLLSLSVFGFLAVLAWGSGASAEVMTWGFSGNVQEFGDEITQQFTTTEQAPTWAAAGILPGTPVTGLLSLEVIPAASGPDQVITSLELDVGAVHPTLVPAGASIYQQISGIGGNYWSTLSLWGDAFDLEGLTSRSMLLQISGPSADLGGLYDVIAPVDPYYQGEVPDLDLQSTYTANLFLETDLTPYGATRIELTQLEYLPEPGSGLLGASAVLCLAVLRSDSRRRRE